jgi:hypothetical protein
MKTRASKSEFSVIFYGWIETLEARIADLSDMTLKTEAPLSQQVWHVKEPLSKNTRHKCLSPVKAAVQVAEKYCSCYYKQSNNKNPFKDYKTFIDISDNNYNNTQCHALLLKLIFYDELYTLKISSSIWEIELYMYTNLCF